MRDQLAPTALSHDRTVVCQVPAESRRRTLPTNMPMMGTEPDLPDTANPTSAAAVASDPESLVALSYEIRLDMQPAPRKPGYGWLLLVALPVILAISAFAVVNLGSRAGGASVSGIGRLDQAYKRTEQALQESQMPAPRAAPGQATNP